MSERTWLAKIPRAEWKKGYDWSICPPLRSIWRRDLDGPINGRPLRLAVVKMTYIKGAGRRVILLTAGVSPYRHFSFNHRRVHTSLLCYLFIYYRSFFKFYGTRQCSACAFTSRCLTQTRLRWSISSLTAFRPSWSLSLTNWASSCRLKSFLPIKDGER